MTAGNVGDAGAAAVLLAEDLPAGEPASAEELPAGEVDQGEPLAVYGDAAYGAGPLLGTLEAAGAQIRCKAQPPVAPAGRFVKGQFTIDLPAARVRCPAGTTTAIRPAGSGGWMAYFGAACASCPLAAQCTSSRAGRTISIGPHEQQLTRARVAQQDPAWQQDYRATRPKVERKIGHLMRRRHGGRQARVHGQNKIAADFSLLAATVNLARLGVLGFISTRSPGWAVATA